MDSSHAVRDIVGRLRLGDHVCQFFGSANDLGEVLVPYFKAGLEKNESCIWITSAPYNGDRAVSEMRAAMPDFDKRAATEQIIILGHDEWYTKSGALSPTETIQGWLARKDAALSSGYAGLRITGNTSFLDQGMWDDFLIYEQSLNVALQDQPILTLCSYCKATCPADSTLEVMHRHGLCLTKHVGDWHLFSTQTEGIATRRPVATPGVDLRAVIADRLVEFVAPDADRIELRGDRVQLSGRQAAYLAIVFQQLAANAAKYGALSTPHGKLTVKWHLSLNGSHQLRLEWVETGMTNLVAPEKVGRGTRTIAQIVDSYLRTFEPSGMTCSFKIDLETLKSD